MNFEYNKIKDPGFFRENRLNALSDHKYFRNEIEAKNKESSFQTSLNGLWKFNYAKNYELAPKGFEKLDYDCKNWDEITVPGHIQMQGYDIPQYINVPYPWDGLEDLQLGEIPVNFNPVASYVKYFTVPEVQRNEQIFVSFQGVESGIALWLNGCYVGYALDGFTPSEFELTPYITDGENKLAVQVFKFTSGSWIEDQDFFRFSGIFRDVYLFSVPKVHIWDMKVKTKLNDEYSEAVLSVSLDFKGSIGKIEAALNFNNICVEQFKATNDAKLSLTIANPKLWSAEKPNLYSLMLNIYDSDGALCEIVTQNIGFRNFEIKNKLMLLNNRPIKLFGVNRHEFSCYTGRVLSKEQMEYDVIMMKRNNINAVRTSHYPNNSYFYELCDRYGIYMIDEVNMESHGQWDIIASCERNSDAAIPGDKKEWLDIVLDRVDSVYQRDKNHPAVLIWSCGNESFGGLNIYKMSQRFRELDNRPVHYEGVHHDPRYPDTTDIYSQMYTGAAQVEEFLRNNREKPFILCEYVHTMGNSGGAMHKYIDLMAKEPLFQGGFIWDFIDQSIAKKDRFGEEFQAYGGDFGDRPCDYNFCGNGIFYADRKPSPKLQTVKYNYQSIVANVSESNVKIINKNLFTNTNEYCCTAILERNGAFIAHKTLVTDVPPLSEALYPLPFSVPSEPGEYAVTVSFTLKDDTIWEKRGYEIAFGQCVIHHATPLAKSTIPIQVIQGSQTIGVHGEHFRVLFSKTRGGLTSYCVGNRELFKNIPMPNFWRAPTDNDMGNNMPSRYAQWKIASMYPLYEKYMVTITETDATITYQYRLPTSPAAKCTVAYTATGDGIVKVDLTCFPKGLPPMPEFGMMFKLDADYENLEWFGMGPEETYIDKETGARLGIYKNKVADNMAKYLRPQECGNKIGVRYAKLTDNSGRGIIFEADGQMEFSALPYTPHEIENAAHGYELPKPHYTVVRVNLRQMGIAGDNSWGALTHEEYLLPADQMLSFTFYFRGI